MTGGKDKTGPKTVQAQDPKPKTPEQQREAVSLLIKEGLLSDVLPQPPEPPEPHEPAEPPDEDEPPLIVQNYMSWFGMTREEAEIWAAET